MKNKVQVIPVVAKHEILYIPVIRIIGKLQLPINHATSDSNPSAIIANRAFESLPFLAFDNHTSVSIQHQTLMLGVSVSLIDVMDLVDGKSIDKAIQKEGITDLILCDQRTQPKALRRMISLKEKTGLKNVIVYRTLGVQWHPWTLILIQS